MGSLSRTRMKRAGIMALVWTVQHLLFTFLSNTGTRLLVEDANAFLEMAPFRGSLRSAVDEEDEKDGERSRRGNQGSGINRCHVLGAFGVLSAGTAIGVAFHYSHAQHRTNINKFVRRSSLACLTPLSKHVELFRRCSVSRRKNRSASTPSFGTVLETPASPADGFCFRSESDADVAKFASRTKDSTPATCSVTLPLRRPVPVSPHRTSSLTLPIQRRVPCPIETDPEPSPTNNTLSPAETPRFHTPSSRDLGMIFDTVDADGSGHLDQAKVEQAIVALEQEYQLGLHRSHANRLSAFLQRRTLACSRGQGITREQFVDGVSELLTALQRSSSTLSLNQLKVVFAAAFERFDADGDGAISLEEFMVAAAYLGLRLEATDAACLYQFFAPTECLQMQQDSIVDERPVWEKLGEACGDALEGLLDRSGWHSAVHLTDRLRRAVEGPGSLGEKAQRAVRVSWECVEHHVADAAELCLSAVGLGLAAKCALDFAMGAPDLAATNMELDPSAMAPLGLLMGQGAVDFAKSLDGMTLRGMTEDEALLYAQGFHSGGFSQAEFQRLMSCKGCRWVTVPEGTRINDLDDNGLKIIVRGRAHIKRDDTRKVRFLPGATIGETLFLRGKSLWGDESVVASEPVTYISWNSEDLREHLNHHFDVAIRMDKLLAAGMARNLRAVSKLAPPTNRDQSFHADDELRCDTLSDLQNMCPCSTEGPLAAEELRQKCRLVSEHLQLGVEDRDIARLAAFVDPENSGKVSAGDFTTRIKLLGEALATLGDVSLDQLIVMLRRAIRSSLGDSPECVLDLHQFSKAVRGLSLELSDSNLETLFSYLDDAGEASIDLGKFCQCNQDGCWSTAFLSAVHTQLDRKNLTDWSYITNRMVEVFQSNDSPAEKAKKVLAIVCQGLENIPDAVGTYTDVAGALTASYHAWNMMAEGGGVEVDDELGMAPLFILVGVLSMHMVRHMSEGQDSAMSARDAMLFTTVFEKQGFSVAEFKSLLDMGGCRVQHLEKGDTHQVLSEDNSLCMVATGSCSLQDSAHGSSIGVGNFIGESALLGGEGHAGIALKAEIPTTLLVWDTDALTADLARDERLHSKMHRIVALSMADGLLRARR